MTHARKRFLVGLGVSALGLGGLVVAAAVFVHGFGAEALLDRLRWSSLVALLGGVTTAIGFATMNIGAGHGFEAVAGFAAEADHERESDHAGESDHEGEPEGASPTTIVETIPRCLGCATDNRAHARFCDHCGDRL